MDPSGQWGGWTLFDPAVCDYELDVMKSWGINCLRLYTRIEWWKNNTMANTPTGTMPHRDVVKTVIEKAAERGIYVIYCPRCVGHPNTDPLPFPPHTADTDVISSEQDFVDYWVTVIQELGVYNNVIWDIWNEPHGDAAAKADWYRVWNLVIDAIRATGDEHLIIVQWLYGPYCNLAIDPETGEWTVASGGVTLDWIENYPFTQTNLVYSAHMYRFYGMFGQKYEGVVRVGMGYTINEVRAAFEYEGLRWCVEEADKPLIIGELGFDGWASGSAREEEVEALNNAFTLFNKWGVSYVCWDWMASGIQCALITNNWTDIYPTEWGQMLIDAISEAPAPLPPIPLVEIGLGAGAGVVTFVATRNLAASVLVALATAGITYVIRNPP